VEPTESLLILKNLVSFELQKQRKQLCQYQLHTLQTGASSQMDATKNLSNRPITHQRKQFINFYISFQHC
jgi:hypothetical protein